MPKMPNLGQVANKLKSLVPDEGDFAETVDEREARGDEAPAPTQAAAPEPNAAPPEPQTAATPSAEAPGEAPPPAVEAPIPSAAAPPPAPDPWADAEEVEIDDEDVGEKYKVKVPKAYADKAKNGYARKSAMSRATGYLGKYKALLEPLITQGRFDSVAQIIEMGERQDAIGEQFRNAMYEVYYRTAMGKPVSFADQAAAAAQPAPAAPVAQGEDPNDPLGLKSLVQEAVAPVQQDAASLKAWRDDVERRNQSNQAYGMSLARAQSQTYADFAQMFPTEFSGNEQSDWPNMQKVFNYAKSAKWFEREGADRNPALMPVAMLKAKLDMDRGAAAATPPPPSVAMGAAQAAEEADRIAREATAKVAASMGAGSPSSPAARPPQRQKPPTKDPKTGKPLNLQQIAAYYKE